jgi:hypothetical protein
MNRHWHFFMLATLIVTAATPTLWQTATQAAPQSPNDTRRSWAYAITLLIQRACRWIGGRDESRRIDTERLLRSLLAYLRGEPKVWSVVRAPSVADEDARGCTASGTV